MQARGEPVTLLDCRDLAGGEPRQDSQRAHISRGNLETKVEALIPRDAHLIIYCASGNRSAFAAVTLEGDGIRERRVDVGRFPRLGRGRRRRD